MPAQRGRALKRLFGISPATVRFLIRNGYIRGSPRAALSDYEFPELLILKTVGALTAAKIPTRAIHRVLKHLNSGQFALPLDTGFEPAARSRVIAMKARGMPNNHYVRALALEDRDARAAEAAYRQCLHGDGSHLEARINLGRLLHLQGHHREAESMYRDSPEPSAILHFNLATLLDDVGRTQEAVASYRTALTHDPGLADAHYNLALLLERAGETQGAFRHLLAYRRLAQSNRL